MSFRGSGKSTLAEEAIIIMACFGEFENCVILGETDKRANERLGAIRFEIETNELLQSVFGIAPGDIWQESRLVLSNGVCIQSVGSGQSLRGVKHHDKRPDLWFIDDLESEETVSTPAARTKLSDWFYAVLKLAGDVAPRYRMAATPLDPEALAVKLTRDEGWDSSIYPVDFIAEGGDRVAQWPDRFSLKWIDAERAEFQRAGKSRTWVQEMMCQAVDPATRVFNENMFRFEPGRVRTFEPVFAVYDPARTVKKTSSCTGRVVGSWVGNRLVVWEANGPFWKPDEIISDMFDVDARYEPVAIGVERDGLEEFLLQPLRGAQVDRGRTIPIEPLRAPKGKDDFIKGLQPFFNAREVIFAGTREDFAQCCEQLVNYPTGLKDIPNAMAYLLTLRPGRPVYEEFSALNVQPIERVRSRFYLCVNAGGGVTTAVLCQHDRGALHVLQDWVVDSDPGVAFDGICGAVRGFMGDGEDVICYSPRDHFKQGFDNTGLRAAAKSCQMEVRRGGDLQAGRGELRRLITLRLRGQPALLVHPRATWTLRAFSAGYAMPYGKDEARPGPYRVLAEGIESFAGLLAQGMGSRKNEHVRTEWTKDGRSFVSARA